jgi:alkylated DNA nucleotide flippase Atl1
MFQVDSEDVLEHSGAAQITPYWRTLKSGGRTERKISRWHRQSQGLAAEGHTVIQKGKRFVVADYELVAMRPVV